MAGRNKSGSLAEKSNFGGNNPKSSKPANNPNEDARTRIIRKAQEKRAAAKKSRGY